jgi:hypothetical protein
MHGAWHTVLCHDCCIFCAWSTSSRHGRCAVGWLIVVCCSIPPACQVDRIDVSNWRRIGYPEYSLVEDMIECANFLAAEEDKL